MIYTFTAKADEINISRKEIVAYLGYYGVQSDNLTEKLIDECLGEFVKAVKFKACYTLLPIEIKEKICAGFLEFNSESLRKNLCECDEAYIFAATAGSESQRLIKKNSVISPLRGIVADCIGSAAIEAFCDKFNASLKKKEFLRPRFSPGYGDLSIEYQKNILEFLEAKKHIGLSLNDSMMMSPSKSVTAIIGIGKEKNKCKGPGCMICSGENCPYR